MVFIFARLLLKWWQNTKANELVKRNWINENGLKATEFDNAMKVK